MLSVQLFTLPSEVALILYFNIRVISLVRNSKPNRLGKVIKKGNENKNERKKETDKKIACMPSTL